MSATGEQPTFAVGDKVKYKTTKMTSWAEAVVVEPAPHGARALLEVRGFGKNGEPTLRRVAIWPANIRPRSA